MCLGKIEASKLTVGDKVRVMPCNKIAQVVKLSVDEEEVEMAGTGKSSFLFFPGSILFSLSLSFSLSFSFFFFLPFFLSNFVYMGDQKTFLFFFHFNLK
jgi:hypothetical protein